MSDIVAISAFIRARLDEEEAAARAAPAGPWTWEAVGASGYPQRVTNAGAVLIAECFENPDRPATVAAHVIRQDPAATLARVAALRPLAVEWSIDRDRALGASEGRLDLARLFHQVQRHLAAIWRDHPAFDPDWAM